MMNFDEALKAAVEQCVENQRRSADHTIRQAFYDGVRFYMQHVAERSGISPDIINKK